MQERPLASASKQLALIPSSLLHCLSSLVDASAQHVSLKGPEVTAVSTGQGLCDALSAARHVVFVCDCAHRKAFANKKIEAWVLLRPWPRTSTGETRL